MKPAGGRDRTGVELAFRADVERARPKSEADSESDDDQRDRTRKDCRENRIPRSECSPPHGTKGEDRIMACQQQCQGENHKAGRDCTEQR
jgi:hypothetical protein